jgi:peptide/nickel transport system substrate-binding protein
VYTFGLLKAHAALDSAGVWHHLSSVTAAGDTVTFTFSSPDVPFAQSIAPTLIVPKHVWSKVANPVTFTNTSPVVSGPYKLASFTPNQYVLAKNSQCWQAAKAPVSKLIFPALTGNKSSQLMLASGNFDWSTLFVPDIRQSWVNKDAAANKCWFPPGGTITLYLNLTQAPFSSVTFRQGLSDGLDRSSIAQKAEDGYVRPASQSGMLLPGMQRWLNPALPGRGLVPYQPQQATALFARAGYHLTGGKLTGPGGKPVTMTIITPNGFTDWCRAPR